MLNTLVQLIFSPHQHFTETRSTPLYESFSSDLHSVIIHLLPFLTSKLEFWILGIFSTGSSSCQPISIYSFTYSVLVSLYILVWVTVEYFAPTDKSQKIPDICLACQYVTSRRNMWMMITISIILSCLNPLTFFENFIHYLDINFLFQLILLSSCCCRNRSFFRQGAVTFLFLRLFQAFSRLPHHGCTVPRGQNIFAVQTVCVVISLIFREYSMPFVWNVTNDRPFRVHIQLLKQVVKQIFAKSIIFLLKRKIILDHRPFKKVEIFIFLFENESRWAGEDGKNPRSSANSRGNQM